MANSFFEAHDGPSNIFYRMQPDGSDRRKALPEPIVLYLAISPDGKWLVVRVSADVMSRGTSPSDRRRSANFPFATSASSVGPQEANSFGFGSSDFRMDREPNVCHPAEGGRCIPLLPEGGIRSEADLKTIRGAELVFDGDATIGPNPEVYAYPRETVQRNLFRVAIP